MIFLYNVIILPVETIIEFVFCFVLQKFDKFGVAGAIFSVSLAVNFLALPLYNKADALQLKERNLQMKMQKWVKHIKKTFKGDEQFFMLQAYYRQNGYHPLFALRSSLSIMIEIPFFIAGYHFLSHCSALEGQSILFLKDLSAPDRLLKFSDDGKFAINVLPVLMTVINIVSAAIYTKGAPLREKIQINALALIFLAILYNSPSGLVFYWILNNTFSLAKNIVLKMKNPGKILHGILSAILIFASIYLAKFFGATSARKKSVVYVFTVLFACFPYAVQTVKNKFPRKEKKSDENYFYDFKVVLFSCVSLFLLAGFVLPSSVISTSPDEFSFLGNTPSPVSYILSAASYFFGLFIFWPLCIYRLFGKRTKSAMTILCSLALFCALLNVYVFKYRYGLISVFFGLEDGSVLKNYSAFFTILPLIFYAAVFALLFLLLKFKKSAVIFLAALTVCISEFFYGTIKSDYIKNSFARLKIEKSAGSLQKTQEIQREITLSRTEKNVVVLFLDRAISSFFPYIVRQFPQLNESFEGFTYYPNTLSFANGTLMGAPALLGGYEYTPDEMNGRKSEKLVKKHNEALKVMPHLFYNAGYSVTLTDPCDANYNNKFGFEVFDDYPEMDVKSVMGKYNSIYSALHDEDAQFSLDDDKTIKKTSRQFSIMQILPPFVRDSFYDGGHYYLLFPKFQASPNRFNLLDSYSALYFMKDFTKFDGTKKTFIMQYNLLMHEPMELRAPDYTPGEIDENHPAAGTGFYKYRSKSDSNGFNDFAAYHVNAASIKMVGEWLSYLKQNDCYDNTRIIIVADHGHHVPLECFGNEKSKTVYASFNPLLLFKDFNSHGEFKTDFKFMTNAETVNLATEGLDEIEGKNPFTGKKFSHAEDFKSFNVYTPKAGERGSARMKEKFVFETEESRSFSVYGNIFDEKNWDRPKSE